MYKSHGHEVPLAKRQRMPKKAIQNILETRKVKLRRLLDHTSPDKHHQNMRIDFITPQIVLEMLRQENKAVAATAA